MNSTIHAKLSCRAAGTKNDIDFAFFNKLHDFMDCSKEVESSNLHRFLTHQLWFVKRVVIPVFGFTYTCQNNREVNLKDDMEQNHLLADNHGKFIASLSDYTSLIKEDSADQDRFQLFQNDNKEFFSENTEIKELMLSPLANTGEIKSLWLTHNSWFVGKILPLIYPKVVDQIQIKDYSAFAPSIVFNRMDYADWVQNGHGEPPSFVKIKNYRNDKVKNLDRE